MAKCTGIVTKSTGSWYEVRTAEGLVYSARLRGKFKKYDLKVTNPIAVGDVVDIDISSPETDTGIITDIHARKNYIIRKSVHKSSYGHLIAANIDQSALVVTLAWPRTSLGFIDRFLVSCEAFRIPAVLIFNKYDLYDEQMKLEIAHLRNIYESLGYRCIETSVTEKQGLEALKEILNKRITLLSGHSGVGKSSILNMLVPELNLRVADISGFAEKGVHTTTFAEMYSIGPDTFVIDTPGIKELGIFEIGEEELSHYFPEMRALLGQCKYHNCRHINEPACAVKEKLQNQQIAESRYMSYLSMIENEDNRK
ncbi:MAG: ribosome small subunit-dependent GTPase A [Cytophagaceae bacterium]|nr:ribosome small subunit-dependent GTPase A [Cytophagaceae bacterium]MDW8456017.1 ribosome small subunit-dependent GTPase A [Cytophagaceae bacterium]